MLPRGISIIKYKNDYRDSIDYKNGIYQIYRVNTEQYLYKNILIKSRFNVERKYIEERSFKSSGKRINRVSWWYWKDWWMGEWRDERTGGYPGKFRKRRNARSHITVVYVRISRSGEFVDGLLLWNGYSISYKNGRY